MNYIPIVSAGLIVLIAAWKFYLFVRRKNVRTLLSSRQMFNLQQDLRISYWLVDTRHKDEFMAGHVDGAVSVPNGKGPMELERQTRGKHAVIAYGPSHCILDDLAELEAVDETKLFHFDEKEYARQYPFMLSSHALYERGRLFPSHYAERMFISHSGVAMEETVMRCLGVTHVINVTPEIPNAFENEILFLSYLRIPVLDDAAQDLGKYLEECVSFADRALADGGCVLIHCKHGQSRSATVAAAWLVHSQALSPAEAIRHLQECRPRVSPNRGFLDQLDAYHVRIGGSRNG